MDADNGDRATETRSRATQRGMCKKNARARQQPSQNGIKFAARTGEFTQSASPRQAPAVSHRAHPRGTHRRVHVGSVPAAQSTKSARATARSARRDEPRATYNKTCGNYRQVCHENKRPRRTSERLHNNYEIRPERRTTRHRLRNLRKLPTGCGRRGTHRDDRATRTARTATSAQQQR